MNEELGEKEKKLVEDFASLPEVKRYLSLKKAVEKNERLQSLLSERKKLQASIKYLSDAKKEEAIKACKEMQIAYDNDPLVINYNASKEEVYNLLTPLTEADL